MVFCYTHKSMPYSVIIREASVCSRQEQMQGPTVRHVESVSLEHTALMGCLHQIHAPRAEGTPQRRKQKE